MPQSGINPSMNGNKLMEEILKTKNNEGAASNNRSELLNQREAADFLRLSPRTLERLRVVSGGPPFARLGRRVVYRLSDLEDWVSERTVRSTSEMITAEPDAQS